MRVEPSDISPELLVQIEGMVHQSGSALVSGSGQRIVLPEALNNLLLFAVESMKRNQSVLVSHAETALTSQQAADYLGMSRPYLLRLLNAGKIPFHKVGKHRRVLLQDAAAYRASRAEVRRAALSSMTKMLDDEGVYDRAALDE